jgi:hypothetical protein
MIARSELSRFDFNHNTPTRYRLDSAKSFVPASIEEHHFVSDLGPQHPRRMIGLGFIERDFTRFQVMAVEPG